MKKKQGSIPGLLVMIGVLLIQCLFFTDRGLSVLGRNVWKMAFSGCFAGRNKRTPL